MPFVGRDVELERLRDALSRAAEEQPSILLVSGEAGVGKTTLLEQGLRLARETGFVVAAGGSVQGGSALAYAPVRAALRGLPTAFDAAELAELVGRHPAAELLMPPGLQGPPPPGQPDPSATTQCVLDLLGYLTERRPLVLALEDLHWADRSTLELVSFIARNLGAERLVVLGTVRTDDLDTADGAASVLAELGRLPSVERLDLRGLDREALRALARDVLGRTPQEADVDDLLQRCGGNPFYAVELLEARSFRRGELPPSVREVLTLRLARLGDRAANVINAASAVGPVVDVDLLAEVLRLPAAEIESALRSGVAAGVLGIDASTGEVAFRHALLREVAYSGLFASERQRLHDAIAEALSQRDGVDPAVLAHHHELAGRRADALVASLRAARAGAGMSSIEMVAQYQRVVALWPEVPDAVEVTGASLADVLYEATLCALQLAALEEGEAFATALLRHLDPADDPERWGLAAARLSELRWEAGDENDAARLLERATEHLAGRPLSEAAVRVLERRAFHAASSGGEAAGEALAGEALRLAAELGDPELEALALNRSGLVHAALGRADGLPMLWQAFRMSRDRGLRQETTRAAVNLLSVLHAGGMVDEALQAGEEVGAAAAELAMPAPHRVGLDAVYARVLVAAGRWDQAADILASTSDSRYPRYRAYRAAARADLAVGRGDSAEVSAALGELDFSNLLLLRLQAAALAAEHALGEQRPHDVERIAGEVLPLARLIPETTVLRLCAFALHTGPDDPDRYLAAARESAETLGAEGRQAPRDLAGWWAIVRGAHADTVGRPSAELWGEASVELATAGFPVRAAWADAYWAAALVREGGDRHEAAVLSASAHATATALGARPLRESVEDLVRRARLEVPGIRRLADGDLGLTEREAEVLRLVAEGRTNREIASALYISPKTASVHVSNILRKVGATNRGEAAAIAHRHGLLSQPETPSATPA